MPTLRAIAQHDYSSTREQRCTVHKKANVLDKLPKRMQPAAKAKLNDIEQAETREAANQAFDRFLRTYQAKYPKATNCLAKDREQLLAFYDIPAENWIHLRTTNPIESTFAAVRHRQRRTLGEPIPHSRLGQGLPTCPGNPENVEVPERIETDP